MARNAEVFQILSHSTLEITRPKGERSFRSYKCLVNDHNHLWAVPILIHHSPWGIRFNDKLSHHVCCVNYSRGELGYDGPLYDGFLHMTDDMLGPSPMHIKYSSYVYDGFCIWRTNFSGPIESAISKFTCISTPGGTTHCLTLPMLRLLSSKAQEPQGWWKPSKSCHAGIHWIALK